MRIKVVLVALSMLGATPAAAQLRVVPDQPASATAARGGVDVYLLNESEVEVSGEAPARIEVTAADGARIALVPAQGVSAMVAAGGFTRMRYLVADASTSPVPAAERPGAARETIVATSTGTSAAMPGRFLPHEPIYGVFGTGDSGAKLQFSFAFRPFDEDDGLLAHLRFAYTQTMFWAIEQPSGPFRATTYSPEVYVDVPIDSATRLGFGYRHDSNGRGDIGSIDSNRLFVRGAHSFNLGDGWQAELAPQAWIYVGKRSVRGDLSDYWGNAALKASILQPDGIKLSATLRGNPDTGRGAGEIFASYPLARIGGGLGIYAFGQVFSGYGEAIDEFRVRDTHARLGIALTR